MRPIRMGLLGSADIAVRRVLPAVARTPDIELVAVAGRNMATARRTADRFGGSPVEGYERLIASPDVDAVYLPLPNALHAPWTLRALEAGKHVLVEKPMTTREDLTADAVRSARRRGLVLRENLMFVHHGQHARVRELVEDGAIGELRQLSATFAFPARPAGDIRHRPELGGGALLDAGVYPLGAAQLFLGTGLEVAGAALRHGPTGVDVEGSALLRRADGVCAHLAFGMDHSYTARYELWGTRGRITVHRAFTPPADHRPEIALEQDGRTLAVEHPAQDQYAAAVAAFVAAVRGSGTREDGLASAVDRARLVDDVRTAAGRPAQNRRRAPGP
ncbi:Gfo/Idh/MocA family oxidoreductase [Streptomyces luteireticuli]